MDTIILSVCVYVIIGILYWSYSIDMLLRNCDYAYSWGQKWLQSWFLLRNFPFVSGHSPHRA